jgi:hypothetical protein
VIAALRVVAKRVGRLRAFNASRRIGSFTGVIQIEEA